MSADIDAMIRRSEDVKALFRVLVRELAALAFEADRLATLSGDPTARRMVDELMAAMPNLDALLK